MEVAKNGVYMVMGNPDDNFRGFLLMSDNRTAFCRCTTRLVQARNRKEWNRALKPVYQAFVNGDIFYHITKKYLFSELAVTNYFYIVAFANWLDLVLDLPYCLLDKRPPGRKKHPARLPKYVFAFVDVLSNTDTTSPRTEQEQRWATIVALPVSLADTNFIAMTISKPIPDTGFYSVTIARDEQDYEALQAWLKQFKEPGLGFDSHHEPEE